MRGRGYGGYGGGTYGTGGRGWRGGWSGGPLLLILGTVGVFALAGAFEFFPFFLLLFLWWVPFLMLPAVGAVARGLGGAFDARSRRPVERERGEKELLAALARWGELSAARAAIETSLGVAEAEGMLSRLAEAGHVEVRARDGRLAYALWESDRRELEERA